ncbi:MAG: peptidoglycan-binding domain-containing protein [Nitratireductor sp.]
MLSSIAPMPAKFDPYGARDFFSRLMLLPRLSDLSHAAHGEDFMRAIAVILIAGLLAACGSSKGDRTASGAGIGAGAGAVVGAVTGLSILEGVLLGAVAGGATGFLTDQDVIDLGDPIWAKSDRPANRSAVARVQAGLTKLGYDPGPIDGKPGPRTSSAIQAYQRDNDLLVDGRPTIELARHMEARLDG